ncbi:MAG: AraC family transcriptional regulator [Paenibacillus sp.]|jgi:AraC-like DNA-binding protein|nr:AraC family transcriptional regulator [Paenibacillus sp.]
MQEYGYEYAESWFNLPTQLEKAGALWLVRSGRNIAKSNYAVGPKVIDCYGFHFILEGKLRLDFEGESVILQKNDLFCLLPHISYTYKIVPSPETLQMVWITMDGGMMPELLVHMGLQKGAPYKRMAVNRSVSIVLGRLIELFASRSADPLVRQSLLLRLFACIGAGGANVSEDTDLFDERRVELQAGHWLTRAVEYIQLHFTEPLSIEEMARMAGVHRSHFSSVFSRETGLSPRQLVLRLRMEKAVSLLQDEALSITETALSVGYPDVYSFSRSLKKFFGRSPSQWMRQ